MHISDLKDRRKELVLLDESNPRSIVSLVPESLKPILRALWNSDYAKLLAYSERRLRNYLHVHSATPDFIDERIRLNFWLEYERVQNAPNITLTDFQMSYVLGQHIAKEAFYKYYVTNPLKLVWMLCPPADFELSLKVSLSHCMDQILATMEKLSKEDVPSKNAMDFLLKTQERLSAQLYGTKVKGEKSTRGEDSEGEAVPEISEPTLSAAEQLKLEMDAITKLTAASVTTLTKVPVVTDGE